MAILDSIWKNKKKNDDVNKQDVRPQQGIHATTNYVEPEEKTNLQDICDHTDSKKNQLIVKQTDAESQEKQDQSSDNSAVFNGFNIGLCLDSAKTIEGTSPTDIPDNHGTAPMEMAAQNQNVEGDSSRIASAEESSASLSTEFTGNNATAETIAQEPDTCLHAKSGMNQLVIKEINKAIQTDWAKTSDDATPIDSGCNNEHGFCSADAIEGILQTSALEKQDDKTSLKGKNAQKKESIVYSSKTASNNDVGDLKSPTELKGEYTGFVKMADNTSGGSNTLWKEIDGRYVFGEDEGTFKQIPYLSRQDDKNKYHKPDLIADIAQIDRLLFIGASLRGESHYAYESVRQDSFAFEDYECGERHFVIVSIADGVGNALYSDQFSDFLVNNISIGVKAQLSKCCHLNEIDWDSVSNYIWQISLEYCKRKTGSDNPGDYYGKWASTLEFIVIDAAAADNNEFVHVTVAGDGGAYLIDKNEWHAIKNGKQIEGQYISNDVVCLPNKPKYPILHRYGNLKRGEMAFIVTDGLGDSIEESPELRSFLGDKLHKAVNLPAFVSVICTSINQMDDDKTGVLIKHSEI